jgi:hypothetical protein
MILVINGCKFNLFLMVVKDKGKGEGPDADIFSLNTLKFVFCLPHAIIWNGFCFIVM